jgi:TBC1 domain family protein 5
MRAQQKSLGRAMSWAVDALMQDSDKLDPNKREALECLSYVRDVLTMGNVIKLDEDRLNRHDQRSSSPANQKTPERSGVTSPTEVVPQVMLSKRDSKPLTGLTRTPYNRKEQNDPLSYFQNTSSLSGIKGPQMSNSDTSSVPVSTNTRSSTHTPSSPSHTPGRRSQSALFGTRWPVEPEGIANNVSVPRQAANTPTQYTSSGYPPTRITSSQRGQSVSAPSIDPLGVLR